MCESDIHFCLYVGCSEGLDAFRFFFKQYRRSSKNCCTINIYYRILYMILLRYNSVYMILLRYNSSTRIVGEEVVSVLSLSYTWTYYTTLYKGRHRPTANVKNTTTTTLYKGRPDQRRISETNLSFFSPPSVNKYFFPALLSTLTATKQSGRVTLFDVISQAK